MASTAFYTIKQVAERSNGPSPRQDTGQPLSRSRCSGMRMWRCKFLDKNWKITPLVSRCVSHITSEPRGWGWQLLFPAFLRLASHHALRSNGYFRREELKPRLGTGEGNGKRCGIKKKNLKNRILLHWMTFKLRRIWVMNEGSLSYLGSILAYAGRRFARHPGPLRKLR